MRCPKCKRKVMKVEGYTVCLNMKCEELIIEEELQYAEIEVGDTVKYHYNKRCEVEEIKDERDMVGRNVLLKVFYDKGWRYRTADIDNLELIEKKEE